MRLKFLVILLATLAFGCASIRNMERMKEEQRISLNFKGRIYNSIVSKYIKSPTWGKIYSKAVGEKANIMELRVENYSSGSNPVWIEIENVDSHIKAVKKYLKWERLARERGDFVDREILKIPSITLGQNAVYSFFSSNEYSHLLSVDFAGDNYVVAGKYAIYFDRKNAIKYMSTLIEFKDGKFVAKDIDSIYK